MKEARMKSITIVIAGTGGSREFKDVSLLPGTRPRDVMDKLELKGFQLMKPEGGAFAHGDDLFEAVTD